MIYINKNTAPEWLLELVKYDPALNYKDLDDATRRKLRNELVNEQYKICCYCCSQIEIDKSHTEHILPKSKYPDKSLIYENLIASCQGYNKNGENCGHYKGSEDSVNDFISPLDENCQNNFKYYFSGEIIGLNETACKTIKLLNLNTYSLMNARKNILKQSLAMDVNTAVEIYSKPYDGAFQPFCNIVKYFLDEKDLWQTYS